MSLLIHITLETYRNMIFFTRTTYITICNIIPSRKKEMRHFMKFKYLHSFYKNEFVFLLMLSVWISSRQLFQKKIEWDLTIFVQFILKKKKKTRFCLSAAIILPKTWMTSSPLILQMMFQWLKVVELTGTPVMTIQAQFSRTLVVNLNVYDMYEDCFNSTLASYWFTGTDTFEVD